MKNISLILVSFLISILFGELILHFFRPIYYMYPLSELDRTQWQEGIYQVSSLGNIHYELKPSSSKGHEGISYQINEFGMRQGPVSLEKKEGTFRIAVIGDSFTFGYGVDVKNSFPRLLEVKLNALVDSVNVEVLNFGVTGYSAIEEAAVVKHKVKPWDPDLIILAYVLNDAETDFNSFERFWKERPWYYSTNIGRLIGKLRFNWLRKESHHSGYYDRIYDEKAENWKEVQESLDVIERVCHDNSWPVVFTIFPDIPWNEEWIFVWDNYEYRIDKILSQVQQEAERHGFGILNLEKTLTSYRPDKLRLSDADMHPTPFCNNLVADTMAGHIDRYYLKD